MSDSTAHPFERLQPDFILDAIEYAGMKPDARLMPLNSFENRVYQVGIEDEEPLIAKFYRPERWSEAQILEEHSFTHELLAADIDAVAPIKFSAQSTLFSYEGFYIALFPRRGGHVPDLEDETQLEIIGRMLGRCHAVGRSGRFRHRPAIDCQDYAEDSCQYILLNWMPAELQASYKSLLADLLPILQEQQAWAAQLKPLRVHGDFHPGNIISRDAQLYMVDLDDTRTALAVQDLWMLLPAEEQDFEQRLDTLLKAYEQFHDFDRRELRLIEYYRTLRILQQAAWVARRWEDPAFPANFTWFGTESYWSKHILILREQLYELQQSLSGM